MRPGGRGRWRYGASGCWRAGSSRRRSATSATRSPCPGWCFPATAGPSCSASCWPATACRGPWLIPVGGILADKIGPRTLMLAADAARCVLVAGLAVLAARHTASLAALGPIAALIGAGEGLFLPASFAIMPSLLDGERLTAGNALSTAAVQAGSLLGPALGGALVAVTHSSTWAFGVDAVSFAVSALSLALIPRRAASGSVTAGGAAASAEGLAEGLTEVSGEARRGRQCGDGVARRGAGAAEEVTGAAGHPGSGHRGEPGERRNERRGIALASSRQLRGRRIWRTACLLRRRRPDRDARRGPRRRAPDPGRVRLGRIPARGGRDQPDALPGRRGRRRGGPVRQRRLQRPGERDLPDRLAEVGLPQACWAV